MMVAFFSIFPFLRIDRWLDCLFVVYIFSQKKTTLEIMA